MFLLRAVPSLYIFKVKYCASSFQDLLTPRDLDWVMQPIEPHRFGPLNNRWRCENKIIS